MERDRDPVSRAFREHPVATGLVVGVEFVVFVGLVTIVTGIWTVPIWAAIGAVVGALVSLAVWRRSG
jgi:hypothetical protein